MIPAKTKPPLKWAGGKRQLIHEIIRRVPVDFKTYYEPFFGGGAVFFAINPLNAVLNDFNSELINLYKVLQTKPHELISIIRTYTNDEDSFYRIRNLDRDKEFFSKLSEVERAARMYYLNRTCYNGLYRVNKNGEFNTPFGKYKNKDFMNEVDILKASEMLSSSHVLLLTGDFKKAVESAIEGDFVYLDPPYDDLGNDTSFASYTKVGFDRNEQIRLKETCDKLNDKGVKFLLSNSATPFILDLYRNYKIEIVKARRSINSKASGRGVIDEVLVSNYE